MDININSAHFKWGSFLWYWSIWREQFSRDWKRPKTLCTYFWMWLVVAPFATAFSGSALLLGGTFVVVVGAWAVGGLGFYGVYEVFIGNSIGWGFIVAQAGVYYIAIRKLWLETTMFPETHTMKVIGEALKAKKRGVCPLVKYSDQWWEKK